MAAEGLGKECPKLDAAEDTDNVDNVVSSSSDISNNGATATGNADSSTTKDLVSTDSTEGDKNELESKEGLADTTTTVKGKDNKSTVPLYDASKLAFNDKAWNDPPPLLMAAGGSGDAPRSMAPTKKLNARVAFPLNSSGGIPSSQATNFDPKLPPPTSGFIGHVGSPGRLPPPPPTKAESPEEKK